MIYIVYHHSLHPNLGEGGGWEGSYFSDGLYMRDLDQTRIFDGNQHFSWGVFFQVGLETLCIKIVNTNLKQTNKKMILIVIL